MSCIQIYDIVVGLAGVLSVVVAVAAVLGLWVEPAVSRTVLWGARKGDVQYGSRDYWWRNIPIGSVLMSVTTVAGLAPGMIVLVNDSEVVIITGIEGTVLGVRQ